MNPVIEACVTSLGEAVRAQDSGADRVEVCVELDCGGLTPPRALLEEVISALEIPVQVLIRPRPGDFVFNAREIGAMVTAASMSREAGARGIVIGALTPRGAIDRPTLQRIQEAGAPLPATMHRAYDETPDAVRALKELLALGFERILTSGHAPTALDGAAVLAELGRLAGERLTIMPGGTVRADNAIELLRRTGARELHARASAIPELVSALRAAGLHA